jgi:hypothetical protein
MDYNNSFDINLSESEAHKKNIEILKIIQLSSQEVLKLKGNQEFYNNNENAVKFINLVSGESQVSIRLIDHFVTKYSKYNKCNFKLIDNEKENVINIYYDYKNQLKHYQKTHFDPFSRGDRIPFFMKDTCIITTIGQLNFFKWFISKKIYDYVLDNKEEIFNDMNKKYKSEKKFTKISKQVKNKEKSIYEPIKKLILMPTNIEKKNVKIIVSFE